MDGRNFDQLTKRINANSTSPRSRRGLLRLGLGGGLAALAFGPAADEVLACRRNKKPCAKDQPNGNCCSGTCRRGTCRPAPGAAGCQVRSDVCQEVFDRCPRNPDGFCVVLDNGKPYCFVDSRCLPCTSNEYCTEFAGGLRGKCLTTCPACGEISNDHVCVYKQRIPDPGPIEP